MGRVDVTAHRENAYAARVPIGEFELDFGSWIYGGTTAELDLYNARFTSDVVTVDPLWPEMGTSNTPSAGPAYGPGEIVLVLKCEILTQNIEENRLEKHKVLFCQP